MSCCTACGCDLGVASKDGNAWQKVFVKMAEHARLLSDAVIMLDFLDRSSAMRMQGFLAPCKIA